MAPEVSPGQRATIAFDTWIVYSVVLPLLVFFVLWPVNVFVWKVPNPFIATFSTGELLPISALVLFGMSADVEVHLLTTSDRYRWLLWLRWIGLSVAVLYLLAYGFLRSEATPLVAAVLDADAAAQLRGFARVSLACLLLGCILSVLGRKVLEWRVKMLTLSA